jgi:hypothetical protein
VIGQSPQRIATIADLQTTTWTDDTLLGNTAYEYQIVIMTDRGETIAGPWWNEILHPLVGIPKPLLLTKLADYGVDTFRLTEEELRQDLARCPTS